MNSDGTSQTRLTNDAAIDIFPAWKPDRSKIAFSANRAAGDVRFIFMRQIVSRLMQSKGW